MNPKKLIKRYRILLVEIKRDFRVLYDVHWRNEFRATTSYSFTHVYCNRCEQLRLRDDKQIFDCFRNHYPLINLERVKKFY